MTTSGAYAYLRIHQKHRIHLSGEAGTCLGFALMEVRDELRRVTQNEMLCDWNTVWEHDGSEIVRR